jgi:integrase
LTTLHLQDFPNLLYDIKPNDGSQDGTHPWYNIAMQRGTILHRGKSWVLRYWDVQIKNGVRVRVHVHKRLAPVGPAYPDKKSVEPLAYEHLRPLNTKLTTPESATPITEFIETVYLPMVKQFLRPSTYKGYTTGEYQRHFKHRLGNLRLRDFRTAHGQRLISSIARDNPEIGHKTLLRLKSFLSGVFRHAKTEGYLDEENPMRDVSLPKTVRRTKFRGEVYTMPEVVSLLANTYWPDYHGRTAFAVVATAAFTGLRLAELRGLQWRDFQDGRLSVKRTMWRTRESLPKTESSENTVPVLPILRSMLDNYRHFLEGLVEEGNLGKELNPTDWIFAGERRGTSMNLPNLVRRTITPLLTRCKHCHNPKHVHLDDHKFELDETIPKWKGFHCFRRSLASNLYSLGVAPKIIQAILRHSDISTTLSFYVETSEAESRDALDKLTALMG